MKRLERWAVNAGDAVQATLLIPADAKRKRQFEIACAITVVRPLAAMGAGVDASTHAARDAWHEMPVQANGTQQWRRRVPTQNPGRV